MKRRALGVIGAVVGDVIGSVYERRRRKSVEFPLFSPGSTFTDDTVCTVAVADALLDDGDFASALRRWARAYPHAGYGAGFFAWAMRDGAGPYNSYGNGSAMRVSPVAYVAEDDAQALDLARRSAAVTHNHTEGIKGAQATALAVFMARRGAGAGAIRGAVAERFGYDLTRALDDIRPGYGFDATCAGSAPQALTCALEATSLEHAIRLAVSLGGDADTQAAIAGAVAAARFGAPAALVAETRSRLDAPLAVVIDRFNTRFGARLSAPPASTPNGDGPAAP